MVYQSVVNFRGRWRSRAAKKVCASLKALPLVLTLVAGVATAQSASSDCQCRAPGGTMRDLGYVECVDIVGTQSLVRCVMSTNTPYWQKLDGVEGCPAA